LYQVTSLANSGLKVSLLVLWTRPGIFRTRASIPAAVLGLLDALVICGLSWLEHTRSARPSTLLQVYLLVSVFFDAARARTLWLMGGHDAVAKVFIAAVVMKLGMAFLECAEKRSLLKPNYKSLTVESTSGILNISIFWWLNRLLISGTREVFSLDDLDDVKQSFRSAFLQNSLEKIWSDGVFYSYFIGFGSFG
jgi:hypothetical protein